MEEGGSGNPGAYTKDGTLALQTKEGATALLVPVRLVRLFHSTVRTICSCNKTAFTFPVLYSADVHV